LAGEKCPVTDDEDVEDVVEEMVSTMGLVKKSTDKEAGTDKPKKGDDVKAPKEPKETDKPNLSKIQTHKGTQESVDEAVSFLLGERKTPPSKDPKAELRNRGTVVFQSTSSKVKDDKDHFPINSIAQARNALARAGQYDSSPEWYKGTKDELVKAVQRAVKKKYPSIAVGGKDNK